MIYWVSPDTIHQALRVELSIYEHSDSVLSGDWDKDILPFEKKVIFYDSFKQRLAGANWEETPYYQINIKKIISGEEKWGCKTASEFLTRCQNLEKIFYDIKEFGFRQVGTEDCISVVIDRDGRLIFCNGRHRLTFAKLLNIEIIPVKIIARHSKWVEFCHQVKLYTERHAGKIYAPIDHPDFTHSPAFHMGRSSYIIDNLLPTGKTILDIGSHWGYLPTLLERLGRKCVAVEVSPEILFFIHQLQKANETNFEIINQDIFEYIGKGKNFDTVLALAIFHHFLKTEELHTALTSLLQSLEMKEMFLLTHKTNENQMKGAFANYEPDEFAEFIIENSCLDTYHEIADFRGRKLLRISQKSNQELYPQPQDDFRIIFLAFINATYPQIFRKVNGQFKGLKEIHPNCHCIVIGTGDDSVDTSCYDFDFIDLRSAPDGLNQKGPIAVDILKRLSPDVVYMRYPVADAHLEYLTRNFSDIIFEHQTFELEELEKSNPTLFFNELAFGATCMQRALGGVGVTDEITNYERRRASKSKHFRTMGNGIDISSLPMSAKPAQTGKLHVLLVAAFQFWHGLDRLIAGCMENPEIAAKFKFHLVGYGPALEQCKELIKSNGLDKLFVFHGHLQPNDIDPLADLCCMSIGVLAPHRKSLSQTSALKHREYVLRGLPVAFAGEDTDLNSGLEFCHIISDNDTPIDIKKLSVFAEKSRAFPTLRLHAREFALEKLSWKTKMKTVKDLASQALATKNIKTKTS